MKAKVEDYLGEINALKGDEDAMEDEMDTVQSDYNAYVTSISEEAAAATATSATDADGNEIPATTEETTTTTEETTTTTTAAAEDSAAATETAGDSDSEETTATEETAAEETTTEAAVETDENGSEVTTTTTAPLCQRADHCKGDHKGRYQGRGYHLYTMQECIRLCFRRWTEELWRCNDH